MSATTPVAGYPVHAIAKFARWVNEHDARFTAWMGECGAAGMDSGHGAFGLAGSARRTELCAACFPGRTWGAARPAPVEVSSRDAL